MRMNGISNHAEFAESSLSAANILMLREKIISTDELIRKYSVERETNGKHVDEVNKLQKTVEHLNKVCMKYENQLSESLRELQPCKESVKQLQEENCKYLEQIRELENKLVAGEKLAQQYEALLKSREEQKDKNYVEKDEMDKQVAKKEKEIKAMKERVAKMNEKLHDRISRSQKLLKCYKTSVKHVLQFGKKLAKQENASKVDQKIIDHYRNVISKAKNSNEPDDNELDISELCEVVYVENSDSSFEVVEENIISSPYKRTPTKAELNEVSCTPASKHKQISKNLLAEFSSEQISQLNSGSLKVTSHCSEMEVAENVPYGMPVINESDMHSEVKHVNSEKCDLHNNSDNCDLQNEKISSAESSDINHNKRCDPRKIEQKQCNKENVLNRIGKQEETGANQLSDDTPYNELEEEIARITFDMCSQGMPFHPLSPIPPTPPPNHTNNENLAAFNEDVAYYRNPRKKRGQQLDLNNVHKSSASDGAVQLTNGMQKLRHQHSEGFEVLSDDMNCSTPNGNGQYSQSSQHQKESSKTINSMGNQFSNNPHAGQNPDPLQQPFHADILHCPVDGNFKINIRMGKFPNEAEDHKITSLNLEVNNITREFNISCSRISYELKNSITETTCPCCPRNLVQQISNEHDIAETSSRQNGLSHTDKSCSLFMRTHSSREKIKPVTPSPSKPTFPSAESDHSIKHGKTDTDGFQFVPSSHMDVDALHQEPTFDHCSPHKIANFSKSRQQHVQPTDDTGNNNLQQKELGSFLNRHKFHTESKPDVGSNMKEFKSSDRQKVQNVTSAEQPQSSLMDKTKQCYAQLQSLPPVKTSVPQNIFVKKTKPLNKQKSITFVEQTKVALSPDQLKNENTQAASAEKSNPQTIRKNIMNVLEVVPASNKHTNNKRPLSDADNENTTGDHKIESASEPTVHLSKKCRLNMKNDVPVGEDSLNDHFWKLGRNIHDAKSSIPKTMEEVQKLRPGSDVPLRNLQSKLANPHHILSTDSFVQSVVLFLANTKKNIFLKFSKITPHPLMTDFETNLVAIVQFLEAKSYNHLKNAMFGLKTALTGSIFSRNKQNSLFGTAAMCRVYIALCRQCGELEQARLLCYDLFCNLPDSALFLVTAAACVWPDILNAEQSVGPDASNKRNFLQNVYIYLLLNGSHTLNDTLFKQCMTVLKKLFNLSPCFNDIIALGKQVVQAVEDSADAYSCPSMKHTLNEASMAVELLAMQAKLLSRVKEFFDDLLMSTFTKWRSQIKQLKYETLLAFWLKVFGVAGYRCFEGEKYCLDSTMKLLSELLAVGEVPFAVQESACISLLTLQSLSSNSYLESLSDWLLQHEQNLSDEGKAFTEKISLKLILETLAGKKEQLQRE